MKGLTGRQQEILDLIRSHIKSNGLPPTRADIARIFGFKSPNAAEQHLRAIEKKGFISILAGASRGIVLNQDEEGIPIIGLVAAGQPILAEENITDKIQVPQNMFSQEADYLLRVRGNSMIDLGIHEDDLIAVKKENDCKNGQVVVARLGDEVTVKTFKIDGEGSVTLEPANEDYSTIEVDPQEGFHLEGICIGVIKSF